eukprot:2519835-Pleurochrysis_carterae.AAC.3
MGQTEAAGRLGWCSSSGEPRAECTPRGGVRGANKLFAPAQPPARAIALSPTGAQSTTSRCPHRSSRMAESLCRQIRTVSRRRRSHVADCRFSARGNLHRDLALAAGRPPVIAHAQPLGY